MICKHRIVDKCKKDGRPCIFSEKCFEPEEQKPMTNADHIRAMSDEELGNWLCSVFTVECCDRSCPGREICKPGHKGIIDWLKSPYKENEE